MKNMFVLFFGSHCIYRFINFFSISDWLIAYDYWCLFSVPKASLPTRCIKLCHTHHWHQDAVSSAAEAGMHLMSSRPPPRTTTARLRWMLHHSRSTYRTTSEWHIAPQQIDISHHIRVTYRTTTDWHIAPQQIDISQHSRLTYRTTADWHIFNVLFYT